VNRRAFVAALGVAAGWPVVARGQHPTRVRRVALLIGQSEDDPEAQVRRLALERALHVLGWTPEKLRIDTRFTAGDPERTRTCVAELVGLKPNIVVAHTTIAAAAALEQTHTIPIVFLVVSDPVGTGLVQSLAHPGGNITGFSNFEFSIGSKWLEVLKEIAPSVRRVSIMFNPDTAPYAQYYLQSFDAAARSLSLQTVTAPVRNDVEIERVLADLASAPNAGLILMTDIFAVVHRDFINRLCMRYHVPTVNANRYITVEGGLVTYGVDTVDLFVRAASYVDRILKGEEPTDLPVQAPTKFELVINLKTAKGLGLTVPPTLLARADEVIE
jgi:ABC-type uncharacterized transport system substrate-binding protein